MCTVTYIPYQDGCILTSNRDEINTRALAIPPQTYEHKGIQLSFPKDPQGSGTWIAANEKGDFVCLLNGAFEPHERITPYRHSRGLVVLDFFTFDITQAFHEEYPLDNIEPFTLVIWKNNALFEFRWDGDKKYLKELDAKQSHIYSSSPLYTKEVMQQREEWFDEFLQKDNINPTSISHFHHFGGELDDDNNIRMKRADGKETVSVSQIIIGKTSAMIYHDLVQDQLHRISI